MTAHEVTTTVGAGGMAVTVLDGPGPAVVWLHGYTMDSTTWAELWALMPGFRHVGVDLPGHGGSAPMAADITLPGLAADVADVAAEHGATRVVALSFGSSTALQWAIDRPDSVSHLVVGAPTIAGVPAEPSAERRYKELAMLVRFAGPGEQMTGLWMASPPDIFAGTERHPAVRAHLRSVVLRHRWSELANGAMGAMTAAEQSDSELAAITAATLVVLGDEDMPTFHGNAKRLVDVVPRCRSETVVGAGHLVLLEQAAAVAPVLTEHLLS